MKGGFPLEPLFKALWRLNMKITSQIYYESYAEFYLKYLFNGKDSIEVSKYTHRFL